MTLIGGGITLASAIFKNINEKQSRKYIDKLVNYQEQLTNELSKPLSEQDDSFVELLAEKISHIQDIAKAQIQAYGQKHNS